MSSKNCFPFLIRQRKHCVLSSLYGLTRDPTHSYRWGTTMLKVPGTNSAMLLRASYAMSGYNLAWLPPVWY
eukprot:1517815-Rhodomonas_salina.1